MDKLTGEVAKMDKGTLPIADVKVSKERELLVPSKETLAAIKRLEAGKGIPMTIFDLIDQSIKVYLVYVREFEAQKKAIRAQLVK